MAKWEPKNLVKCLKFARKYAKRIVEKEFWEYYRIMIDKIGTNNQPLVESGLSAAQPNNPRAARGSDVDVSVQVNYASLVEKAMQPPKTDDQRVQQARELLLSGKLQSKRNIRKAAENILRYGI
jgi:hypothetical protein